MAWFKGLALALRAYGWKNVVGALLIFCAVYYIIELFIVRYKKEEKGKKLSQEDIKEFTKKQITVSIICIIIGVGLFLWP